MTKLVNDSIDCCVLIPYTNSSQRSLSTLTEHFHVISTPCDTYKLRNTEYLRFQNAVIVHMAW